MYIKKHLIILFAIGSTCCVISILILLGDIPAGLYREVLSATVSGCLFSFPNFIIGVLVDAKQIKREYSNSLMKLEASLRAQDNTPSSAGRGATCVDVYYTIVNLNDHYTYCGLPWNKHMITSY